MVVLAILALLIFGPEGLPGIIKNVMRTVKAVRAAASDFQSEVSTALEIENERIDKSKRRRRTAPLNSSSLSGEVPSNIDEALPQLQEKSQDSAPDESAEPALELEEPEIHAPLEEESLETERSQDLEKLETDDDDDDGPGLPMVRKKVEETA